VIRADALGQPMPEPQYDDVLVERVLEGLTGVHIMLPERIEVVRRWQSSGQSLAELERRTGWKVERYVSRDQQAVAS
jgi:hypothetical protein